MEKINFDRGMEVWFAYYYDILRACFASEALIDQFGKYAEEKFNEQYLKSELSRLIFQAFVEELDGFMAVKPQKGDCNYFLEGEVRYNKKFKYIRFPDFICNSLEGHVLRIDINPCLKKGTMTKIYCISRYHTNIDKKDIIDFSTRFKNICDKTLKAVAGAYLKILDEFLEVNNKIAEMISAEPYKIVSFCLGSDDKYAKEFVRLSTATKDLQKYWKNSTATEYLRGVLSDLNHSTNKPWKLSDYEWINHTVFVKDKQASGYIGYKDDDEYGYFIGITDSYPEDVLRPLHLDIIDSN